MVSLAGFENAEVKVVSRARRIADSLAIVENAEAKVDSPCEQMALCSSMARSALVVLCKRPSNKRMHRTVNGGAALAVAGR